MPDPQRPIALAFLTTDDTPLANKERATIDGVRAAMLARGDCRLASSPAVADAIILEEKFCYKNWRYIRELLADPIVGRYAHKVYTINRDDAATGLLKGIYTSMLRRRRRVGLHRAVHYAYWPNKGVLTGGAEPRPEPRYLATWSGNTKSNRALRGAMVDLLEENPAFCVEPTDSWLNHRPDEQARYVEMMRGGKFALCPAGWAAASFRIYESMALGICPVIIADQFYPPAGPDWRAVSIHIWERDLPELESILTEHAPTFEERGRKAREAWLRYFCPEVSMNYYAEQLMACIRPHLGAGDPRREVARWRSLRTHWENQWTLPQRFLAMLERRSERRRLARLARLAPVAT